MTHTPHSPQTLYRAIRDWNRRIQQALDAGHALTDPEVVALSHALDRCIATWYHRAPNQSISGTGESWNHASR
ncbi:MAG: hypothetical protein ACYCOU_24865 [Sulfobacillus sp.]